MLSLTEYIETNKWANDIDESIINLTEGYNLSFDYKTQKTIVHLLDKDRNIVGEGKFNSPELAVSIIEEYFDLDEEDKEWNDSYQWADKNDLNESVESIEKFIERHASDFNVRMELSEGVDGIIKVYMSHYNNNDDVESFVREVGTKVFEEYGAQTIDSDDNVWTIML